MKNKYSIFLAFIGLFISIVSVAQKPRFMRSPINSRSINSIYPVMSGNGNALLYMSDYTDDGGYEIQFTYKNDQRRWVKPGMPDVVKPQKANMLGGYCLDFEGAKMIFSQIGGNNVGGYDLYLGSFDNGKWSQKKNIGAPVNSSRHETYPAFSPDGKRLYFTRCNTIFEGKGSECKIMVAEKRRRYVGWEEPKELPSAINFGNAMMPRILADGRTMYFMAGQGNELDWYFTRRTGENWSQPEKMDFINESEGKPFLAVYYRPDQLLTSLKNEYGKLNLAEINIPSKYQPVKAIIKTGVVTDASGNPLKADLRALDYETGKTVVATASDSETGEFSIIISEGKIYDYSVLNRTGNELYHSEILDYTTIRNLKREKINYTLSSVESGLHFPLKAINFEEYSDEIDERSGPEIRRLLHVLRNNESFGIQIAAFQDSVIMDTIPRIELPEVITDTTISYEIIINPDSIVSSYPEMETFQIDSILTVWNDSLATVRNDTDTLLANVFVASIISTLDSVEHINVHYTYHNDLTEKRAQRLADVLIEGGINTDRIIVNGYGDKKRPFSEFDPEAMKKGVIELIFFRK